MKKKILMFALAVAGMAASCDKNDSSSPSTPMPPTSSGLVAPSMLAFTETSALRATAVTYNYSYAYTNFGKLQSVTVTQSPNNTAVSTTMFGYDSQNMLRTTTYTDNVTAANSYSETYSLSGTALTVTVTPQAGAPTVNNLVVNAQNQVSSANMANGDTYSYTYDATGNETTVTGTGPLTTAAPITYTGVGYFAKLPVSSWEGYLMSKFILRNTMVKTLKQNPLIEEYTNGVSYVTAYVLNSANMPETSTTTIAVNDVLTTTATTTNSYNNSIPTPSPVVLNIPNTITVNEQGNDDDGNPYVKTSKDVYTFNPANNVLTGMANTTTYKVTVGGVEQTETSTSNMTYAYDGSGRILAITSTTPSGADDYFTTIISFNYDRPGFVDQFYQDDDTDRYRNAAYTIDAATNRAIFEQDYDVDGVTPTTNFPYTYDDVGNITSNGVINYSYDTNNNIFANMNAQNDMVQSFLILNYVFEQDVVSYSNINNITEINDSCIPTNITYTDFNSYNFPTAAIYSSAGTRVCNGAKRTGTTGTIAITYNQKQQQGR